MVGILWWGVDDASVRWEKLRVVIGLSSWRRHRGVTSSGGDVGGVALQSISELALRCAR